MKQILALPFRFPLTLLVLASLALVATTDGCRRPHKDTVIVVPGIDAERERLQRERERLERERERHRH